MGLPQATDAVVAYLAQPTSHVPLWAYVGATGDPRIISEVHAISRQDPDPARRRGACMALGQAREPQVLAELARDAATQADPELRLAEITALGCCQAAASTALLSCIDDADDACHAAALSALCEISRGSMPPEAVHRAIAADLDRSTGPRLAGTLALLTGFELADWPDLLPRICALAGIDQGRNRLMALDLLRYAPEGVCDVPLVQAIDLAQHSGDQELVAATHWVQWSKRLSPLLRAWQAQHCQPPTIVRAQTSF